MSSALITRKFLALLAVGLLGAALGCGGGESPKSEASAPPAATTGTAASTAASGGSTGTASFAAKVSYEGSVPAPQKLNLNEHPNCTAMHKEVLERRQLMVQNSAPTYAPGDM